MGNFDVSQRGNRIFERKNDLSPSENKIRTLGFSISADQFFMGKFIEFAEILEGKIKNNLVNEAFYPPKQNLETLENPEYLHLSWLLGSQIKQNSSSSYPHHPYRQFHKPPPPRKPHSLDADQKKAWEVFAKYKTRLDLGFTRKELKQAFRALALKLHPDQGGKAQDFLEMKRAYEALSEVFECRK